jgi:hypothetical protein
MECDRNAKWSIFLSVASPPNIRWASWLIHPNEETSIAQIKQLQLTNGNTTLQYLKKIIEVAQCCYSRLGLQHHCGVLQNVECHKQSRKRTS